MSRLGLEPRPPLKSTGTLINKTDSLYALIVHLSTSNYNQLQRIFLYRAGIRVRVAEQATGVPNIIPNYYDDVTARERGLWRPLSQLWDVHSHQESEYQLSFLQARWAARSPGPRRSRLPNEDHPLTVRPIDWAT